jgi:hypothetical protein
MTMVEKQRYQPVPISIEAEIDNQLEGLIRRVVKGTASEEDRVRYQQLVARRGRKMNMTFRKPSRTRSIKLPA